MACLMGIRLISDLPTQCLRYLGQWQNNRPSELSGALACDGFQEPGLYVVVSHSRRRRRASQNTDSADSAPGSMGFIVTAPLQAMCILYFSSSITRPAITTSMLIPSSVTSVYSVPPASLTPLPGSQTDDGLACATLVQHNPANGDQVAPRRCDSLGR